MKQTPQLGSTSAADQTDRAQGTPSRRELRRRAQVRCRMQDFPIAPSPAFDSTSAGEVIPLAGCFTALSKSDRRMPALVSTPILRAPSVPARH
jgi:hypothetical protein